LAAAKEVLIEKLYNTTIRLKDAQRLYITDSLDEVLTCNQSCAGKRDLSCRLL